VKPLLRLKEAYRDYSFTAPYRSDLDISTKAPILANVFELVQFGQLVVFDFEEFAPDLNAFARPVQHHGAEEIGCDMEGVRPNRLDIAQEASIAQSFFVESETSLQCTVYEDIQNSAPDLAAINAV